MSCSFFFFNDTATTEIYTLSLHDALPIYLEQLARSTGCRLMIRLVKGAYWDSEIKRAQVAGRPGYPVYTTKPATDRSEEHTSELQSQSNLVCRLLLEKKKNNTIPLL